MSIYRGRALDEIENGLKGLRDSGEETIEISKLLEIINTVSYEQFKQRASGEEMGKEFSDFVNSSHSGKQDDFVDYILRDHRTLQQSAFRIFYHCIEGWAKSWENDRYDLRNEATCRMSKEIVDATSHYGIPLV